MKSFEIATKKNKRKQLWKTVLLASCLVFTLLVTLLVALHFVQWQLTKDMILAIEQNEELLAELPFLKASLDYRMPYFNVLNYIQIELINRLRRGELSKEQESLIHITINGVATGLRNSG